MIFGSAILEYFNESNAKRNKHHMKSYYSKDMFQVPSSYVARGSRVRSLIQDPGGDQAVPTAWKIKILGASFARDALHFRESVMGRWVSRDRHPFSEMPTLM